MSFGAHTVVDVRAWSPKEWLVLRQFEYDGKTQHFDVLPGERTDFASVPRVFLWFLPQYGRYTQAAILHDHLWRKAVPAGTLTLPEADAILRRAMRELGVPFLRRWLMWAAVRIGALTKPGGRRRWLRDSYMVFPLLLLALPIVGPPAVLILVALLLFWVVEYLFYLPLKLSAAFKARKGKPGLKAVNAPELSLRQS
jgi:hypothetical protein